MSVNIFHKSTGDLIQIAGNALVGGGGGSTPTGSVIFRDKANFPTVGDTSYLYVATDEDVLYRWNDTLNKYIQLDDTASIKEVVGNI